MIRVALPVDGDLLCPHFGGASAMALIDADPGTREIIRRRDMPTPPHQPGVLPRWVQDQGAEVVIAGGIGERAVIMLADAGIRVVQGAAVAPVLDLVHLWMDGRLTSQPSTCTRDHHHGDDHDACH